MERFTDGREGAGSISYRLVVDGEVGEDWAAWFGRCTLRHEAGRTIMDVTVADQSELHGLLRRIHDLHLRLVALTRLGNGGS